MARLNVAVTLPPVLTHEGTPAVRLTPIRELRRSVLASLLWENTHYESGSAHAKRVAALVPQCDPVAVAALAVEARDTMYLRHVPLFLVRELARVPGNGILVADTLAHVIQRPDEMGEYLAIYWGPTTVYAKRPAPLSNGSRRGLARAFAKFTPYQLAKYDRDAAIKLRDVLRLTRPKPVDALQAQTWRQTLDRTLETPDTWEVELSAGKNKRETFERLLRENKLGGLAFLRNLRNMIEANVDRSLILSRFGGSFHKVLPFRFVSAAMHAPQFEPELERAMFRSLAELPKLAGKTALIVDTSPSMWQDKVSAKSELTRFDAAAALAMLIREVCEQVHIWTFNERCYDLPPRRGFALRDAMAATQGSASRGGLAVTAANDEGYDRIVVLTDGQWHYSTPVDMGGWQFQSDQAGEAKVVSPKPLTDKAYMINVGTYENGIGYGPWVSIDGWSERVIDFVSAHEAEGLA